MAEILFGSAAQQEYADALVWYAERGIPIAEDFELAIENALKDISQDPDRFPKCDRTYRFYIVRRFSFSDHLSSQQQRDLYYLHRSHCPRYALPKRSLKWKVSLVGVEHVDPIHELIG